LPGFWGGDRLAANRMKTIRRTLPGLCAATLAVSMLAQPTASPELPLKDSAKPPAPTRPSPPPLALPNLWAGQTTEVAPKSGFAGTSSAGLSNSVARFRYAGPDGVLEYEWRAPQPGKGGLFGNLTLHAQMAGDAPVEVPVAKNNPGDPNGPAGVVFKRDVNELVWRWAGGSVNRQPRTVPKVLQPQSRSPLRDPAHRPACSDREWVGQGLRYYPQP